MVVVEFDWEVKAIVMAVVPFFVVDECPLGRFQESLWDRTVPPSVEVLCRKGGSGV
jgi:hypothetical protein